MQEIQELTDEQKLMIAIGRDEHVFKQFFLRNFVVLKDYAFSIVRDDLQAEDIASEVLWRTWNLGDRFIEVKSISAYLYRATKNSCLNQLRNKVIQYEPVSSHKDNLIDDLSPETLLLSNERMQEIEGAINQLSPKTKEAFLLVKDYQLTYKEAGESMGISPKTVDRHIQLALKKLYFLLKEKK